MVTNARIANAFKVATQFLAHSYDDNYDNHIHTHICWALYNSHFDTNKVTHDEMSAAHSIIRKRLGKEANLNTWLHYKHPELDAEYHQDTNGIKMQATRHAWLDSLIAEFKAKGD